MSKRNVKGKTHKELVEIGHRWLLRIKQRNCEPCYSSCSVAFKEIVTSNSEIPDCIGFNMFTSILVECKASREDFLSDKNKFFRKDLKQGMGEYRFYLINEGVARIEEVPESWGLLIAKNKSIRILKDALKIDGYAIKSEKRFLVSLLRRISYFDLLDILNDTKMKPLEYEYDVDEVSL